MKRFIASLALFLGVLVAAGAAGQQGAEAPAAPSSLPDAVFFESMDVNVVNVEVYVTDKQGGPITDLSREDFQLFEDGRPMTISNFLAVHREPGERPAPQRSPPLTAEVTVTDPLAPPAAAAATAPPEALNDQRLYVILYFDNLHLHPHHRNQVAREVRGFLRDNVVPGDQVMVVTFERSLHVRQSFTEDLGRVSEALLSLEKLSAFAVQKETERDQIIVDMEMKKSFRDAETFVDAYAKSSYHDLSNSIDGLKDLVASVAGLPGRKALLYVSDGIPMTAAADLYHLLDLRFGKGTTGGLLAQRYSARHRFQELAASANASRVTFYTVDAAGTRSLAAVSAENRGSQAGGSLMDVEFTRTANLQEPLQMMALDTGGLAALNTHNFDGALARMGRDLRSYYSLGYVPGHAFDGRYHEIEVKVRRKGASVRYRAGYRDKTKEARLAEGVLASLLHGVGDNPLALELEVGRARPRDDGYWLVPLKVRLPMGKVTLVPQGRVYRGELRLVQAVLDDEGRTSPPEQRTLPLEIPPGELEVARRQEIVYEAELVMRRGLHLVAIGLRDMLSGETAYVREPVVAGSRGR